MAVSLRNVEWSAHIGAPRATPSRQISMSGRISNSEASASRGDLAGANGRIIFLYPDPTLRAPLIYDCRLGMATAKFYLLRAASVAASMDRVFWYRRGNRNSIRRAARHSLKCAMEIRAEVPYKVCEVTEMAFRYQNGDNSGNANFGIFDISKLVVYG